MVKTCSVCGNVGEPTWRDGTYYCAACGAVIDMTTPSPVQPVQPVQQAAPAAGAPIAAVCPICKNTNGNMLINGRCRCGMCGTMFDYTAPVYQQPVAGGYQQQNPGYNPYYYQQRRAELERKKNRALGWGIFWIFMCWPIAIYQFYKMSKISDEITRLDYNRF